MANLITKYRWVALMVASFLIVSNVTLVAGTAGAKPFPAAERTGRQHQYTEKDVVLLARLVYGEARGESYKGQVAVAAVVVNRLGSEEFGSTMEEVIYEPDAFTAVNDGQINLTPDETAIKAAQAALNGGDPTGGALYYFNPGKSDHPWMQSRPVAGRIGSHLFLR
jgi:N-acetylmuramoyl-L-alanine amidase